MKRREKAIGVGRERMGRKFIYGRVHDSDDRPEQWNSELRKNSCVCYGDGDNLELSFANPV